MILEFENSSSQRRLIGTPETMDEARKIIKKFLDDHNFKSYYSRYWMEDDELKIDVGSHSEFFYVKDLPKDFVLGG